jgi:hypothetical protein
MLCALMADTVNRIQSNLWTAATGWQGWNPIAFPGASALPGSPVIGVSRRNDLIDAFWADEAGRTMSAAFDPLRGWLVIGNIQNGRTTPGGYVTAVSRTTDFLDIFTVGIDNFVYRNAWDPTSPWPAWTGINGAVGAAGAAAWPASRAPANIDVFFGAPAGSDHTEFNTSTVAFDVPRKWLPPFVVNNSTWALDERQGRLNRTIR